jgi:hypothetical protein
VILEFTTQNAFPTDEETNVIIQRVEDISVEILTAVNLFKMLENEGYILLLRRATIVPNESKFGGCISGLPSITHGFADPSVSGLLLEYVHKEIIVTEEFRRFCEQGFIARDEQRFRRQIRIPTIGLYVAIAALLVNAVFNILPKVTGGTKIKQEQIDTLAAGLRSVGIKLDSLNNTAHTLAPLVDSTTRNNPRVSRPYATSKH